MKKNNRPNKHMTRLYETFASIYGHVHVLQVAYCALSVYEIAVKGCFLIIISLCLRLSD